MELCLLLLTNIIGGPSLGDRILLTFMLILLYAVSIWSYLYPRESMLFLQRWRYKEEPEFTDTAIRLTKFSSMLVMILITIILISSFVGNPFIKLLLFLGFFAYIIIGVFRLLPK
ncbi:hypothetical protein [Oceanobacillus halotolerans]|uniref:hypothetical protein n=1 Tax=Oceanobacillus halotolerans TaxID=2663380 RepID=UPI0013DD7D4D|nr:hypothetical protein [Oceanobacillus halotolerans]